MDKWPDRTYSVLINGADPSM